MPESTAIDATLPAYEPIELREVDNELPRAPDDDVISQSSWTNEEKETSRLPPRPLKHERPLRPFALAFLGAFAIFFAFLSLLRYISILKPDVLPALNQQDAYGTVSKISCDLINKNGSAMQNAFLIDLRSPLELSFLEAKLIDVMWDLMVGQGGRFLMGWISYRVFMDSLVALMETTAVNYDVYTSIAFSTTSLWALWEGLKALFGLKGGKAKAFMLWFALAVTYVLAFPTLMGAATGYVNPSVASYSMGNGSYVSAESIKLYHCAKITKGSLIGLDDNELIKGPLKALDEAAQSWSLWNYASAATAEFNRTYEDFLPFYNTGGKFRFSRDPDCYHHEQWRSAELREFY